MVSIKLTVRIYKKLEKRSLMVCLGIVFWFATITTITRIETWNFISYTHDFWCIFIVYAQLHTHKHRTHRSKRIGKRQENWNWERRCSSVSETIRKNVVQQLFLTYQSPKSLKLCFIHIIFSLYEQKKKFFFQFSY